MSLAIVATIVTVILLNQSTYTEAASLANLADEVAASFAEAQAYGIAVKERAPGSADFSASYGISLSLLSPGETTAYIAFTDRNGNEIYDGTWACETGGTNECLVKTLMTRGNYLYQICAIRSSGTDLCSNIERVDASFERPEAAARVNLFNNGGQNYSPANLVGAKIYFRSPSGLTRTVSIYESGQVSVQ